ncbi:LuxR C-terminal-related transcriptional regulator [Microvirga sp. GCM10011540]|uniref:LuxR C-terminal-related transcriptional regulator n=1 Tax=Microvirga sp. GCM10011540 TaxID=3317338 RepID=UPI00360EDE2F
MSFHGALKTEEPSIARCAPSIPTFLVCRNSILAAGVKHILADTCFDVRDAPFGGSTSICCDSSAKCTVFIVEAPGNPSEMTDLILKLMTQDPTARIVILADSIDPDLALRAYRAGAAGFIQTKAGRDVLIKSLELVALGENTFPVAAILATIRDAPSPSEDEIGGVATGLEVNASAPEMKGLSGREREILCLLTQGAPNKMIARKLGVAEATVKVHLKAILRKIRVQNRTQAAMWATTHLQSARGESATG